MTIAYTNSYKVHYPWEKNLASRGPTALGRARFFARGLIFEDFSTLGMKKFPYLKTGPFGNPIFSGTSWTDSNQHLLMDNSSRSASSMGGNFLTFLYFSVLIKSNP